MAKKLSRKGKDLIKYAKKHDCDIRSGKGSHFIVTNPKGGTTIPNTCKDLPTGTFCSIIKAFIKMGILLVILGFSYLMIAQYLMFGV